MNFAKLKFLVCKLKNGEKKYFNEFYDLTRVGVFYVVKNILKDSDLVEDIMQETYIKFLNSMQNIDENDNPYSYLLTIARNKSIDVCKKNSKINFFEDIDIFERFECDFNAIVDMPLLKICKEKLSNEEYKILELSIIFGFKRVEIAKILHEPKSTINWKYRNILKKAKEFYKEVYNENKQNYKK